MRVIDTKPKASKRQINADTDERYFSFFEAKSYINSLDNFNDKIIYLMDEIFEYNQADIVSLNNKLQPYDKQCTQLIEQLQIMRKVKNDFEKENQEKLFGKLAKYALLLVTNHFQCFCSKIDTVKIGK